MNTIGNTAHVHPQASVQPNRFELVADWLPGQPWFDGDPAHLESCTDIAGEGGFRARTTTVEGSMPSWSALGNHTG